jgi:hypothetical protein
VVALAVDPLYIIFEKHLFESSERSKSDFVDVIVNDYMNYLKFSGAIIPIKREHLIVDEVTEEVCEVLKTVLKTQTSISDYLLGLGEIDAKRERAQKMYFELF